jgi:hypothetical protein
MQHVTFLSSKLPIEFGFVEMRWWWMVSGVAFIGVKVLSFANSHFLRPILVSPPTKQSTTGPWSKNSRMRHFNQRWKETLWRCRQISPAKLLQHSRKHDTSLAPWPVSIHTTLWCLCLCNWYRGFHR